MSRRLSVPAAVVLALLTGLLAGPNARAAAAPVRIMTFNICGNVCRHGEVARTAGNIAYQIVARRATVTMLQEVCYAQFLGVRARLARRGYTAVFGAAGTGGRCDDFDRAHGRAFGVAIVARGTLTRAVVRALPSPSTLRPERRVLLGATLRVAGRSVFVATTHTAPGGPNLAVQLAALEAYLTPIAAVRPVIFGGDLNALPENTFLDPFYREFREANGTRTHPLPTFTTVPRKIDYLFAGRRWLRPRAVTVATTRYSDHRMYVGTFG